VLIIGEVQGFVLLEYTII